MARSGHCRTLRVTVREWSARPGGGPRSCNVVDICSRAKVVPGRREHSSTSSPGERSSSCTPSLRTPVFARAVLLPPRPARPGPVRPRERARRLRCRVPGRHRRARHPRDGRAGPDGAAQPRAPRRLRQRARDRRRRRHPHPGPRRVPARRPGRAGRRAARAGAVRRRHRLPVAGRPPRPSRRAPPSTRSPPRRACAPWPGASCRSTRDGAGIGRTARSVMPSFWQVVLGCGDGSAQQQGTALTPYALERRAYVTRKRTEHETGTYFPSLSSRTAGLQGHAHDRPAAAVLPRPVGRAVRQRAGAGAQPLLDEHLPELAAGPPLPLHRAQRRDQHRARQPQLDARPRGAAARPARAARRPVAAVPGLHAGRLRQRQLRRGARAAAHGRPVAAARGADDGPGGVGERARHGPGQARLLPVPRLPDGAVGRPGLRDLHRRHADRRGARPQRPAPGALVADRRRPRRAGQRGRRARHPRRPGRAQGPAAAREDVPRRHRAGPHRRGRRDQGRARRRAPVRRLAARRPARPERRCRRASTSSTATSRCCAASRSSATPRRSCASCSPRWRRPAPSRSARWAPTRPWRC